MQKQEGVKDCGILAVAMAFNVCQDKDPFEQQYKQSELRQKLEIVFSHRSFEMFRSSLSEPRRVKKSKRVVASTTRELYCVCRQPEIEGSRFGSMACCDRCQKWYHAICLSIPSIVFTDESRKWFCKSWTICLKLNFKLNFCSRSCS